MRFLSPQAPFEMTLNYVDMNYSSHFEQLLLIFVIPKDEGLRNLKPSVNKF